MDHWTIEYTRVKQLSGKKIFTIGRYKSVTEWFTCIQKKSFIVTWSRQSNLFLLYQLLWQSAAQVVKKNLVYFLRAVIP